MQLEVIAMKRLLYPVTGLALVATIGMGTAQAFFGKKPSAQVEAKNLWTELPDSVAQKERIQLPSLAPLIERASPAVLVVTTEAVTKVEREGVPPELENHPFREFFRFFGPQGQMPMPERKRVGQGSGF